MTSYAHDAEVIVYNYNTRSTESSALGGLLLNGLAPDPLATTEWRLRDAIVSVQTQKSKNQPQGTFVITLKPTKEWTKILVPGSWCAIFMSDQPLKSSDLNNQCKADGNGGILCPLKMIGMIMAVRVQKARDGNGAYSLTYTITGYDFGYIFTTAIYVNQIFQDDVQNGVIKGPLSQLSYKKDGDIYGDPAENIQRILRSWSIMSQGGALSFVTGVDSSLQPPPIRMKIPQAVCNLLGTGNDVLQMVNAAIGVDKRTSKVMKAGVNGKSDSFKFKLIGEKAFIVWQLITQNTLWGMINQYLNPTLNEAYCDLHPIATSILPGVNVATSAKLQPTLIVRQIPYNTPKFNYYWTTVTSTIPGAPAKYPVTNLVSLPKTTLPSEKVLGYDVGYSEYERVNFVEVNGFDINLTKTSPGAFAYANRPRFEPGSIKRFGLRPKISLAADYGVIRQIDSTCFWSPLLMDWWFSCNKYASGTIECIGLLHHIAVGENIQMKDEEILGHVESVSNTFTVDENGNRIFRTSIEFSRGISSKSTPSEFKYIYGDDTFGGNGLVSTVGSALNPQQQKPSIFEDDVNERVSFTKNNPTT
jgi:hypothetical protein